MIYLVRRHRLRRAPLIEKRFWRSLKRASLFVEEEIEELRKGSTSSRAGTIADATRWDILEARVVKKRRLR